MEGDDILHYAEMVQFGIPKWSVLKRLPDSAWILGKDGRMPSSNTLKRIASPIFQDDLVQFEFDMGVLQAITVDCRRFPRKTPEALHQSWETLRGRVSKQLRQPGLGRAQSSEGTDQRCLWSFGPVTIQGLSTLEKRQRRLRLKAQIPRTVSESPPPSLEDLYIS
jgi:hypothetical protein